MTSNILISATNISKNFGKLKVLDDISLSLSAGEITCVLGGSGCGKTTLLKILSGLEKPSVGNVISKIDLPGKFVGYMSQEDSLLPWKTAIENVAFASELLDKKDIRHALKMLKLVNISRFHSYYPAELSGGQKQRVNLARMLAISPKVLFLDEPLSALDIVVKNDLTQVIRNYVKDNEASALMITHSIEEALLLADRIIILSTLPAHISAEYKIKDNQRESMFSTIKNELEKAIRVKRNA